MPDERIKEKVVLLNENGLPRGTMLKSAVHSSETPLHLAFSCYIQDPCGKLLVTRRSLSKQTWPGVWTNSFCGHPLPGEAIVDAVHRRAAFELGMSVSNVELALPDFRYKAIDASGIVENEVCPVYLATTISPLHPNPSEVMAVEWIAPGSLLRATLETAWAFSPWMTMQISELCRLGFFPGMKHEEEEL